MTCKDCLHFDVCDVLENNNGLMKVHPTFCACFKDKNDFAVVIQCKDCKHYEIHKPSVLENCERNGAMLPMKPSDFCSYGERKDGADNER